MKMRWWERIAMHIGAAAYDGNRMCSRILRTQARARQVWHVLFGHTGDKDLRLPESTQTEYDIRLLADIKADYWYTRCDCGIIEHKGCARRLDA